MATSTHPINFLRQGVWASITGGWFYDPGQTLFCNTLHMYVWLFLFATPLLLSMFFYFTWHLLVFYVLSAGLLFTAVKLTVWTLNYIFDKHEPIQKCSSLSLDEVEPADGRHRRTHSKAAAAIVRRHGAMPDLDDASLAGVIVKPRRHSSSFSCSNADVEVDVDDAMMQSNDFMPSSRSGSSSSSSSSSSNSSSSPSLSSSSSSHSASVFSFSAAPSSGPVTTTTTTTITSAAIHAVPSSGRDKHRAVSKVGRGFRCQNCQNRKLAAQGIAVEAEVHDKPQPISAGVDNKLQYLGKLLERENGSIFASCDEELRRAVGYLHSGHSSASSLLLFENRRYRQSKECRKSYPSISGSVGVLNATSARGRPFSDSSTVYRSEESCDDRTPVGIGAGGLRPTLCRVHSDCLPVGADRGDLSLLFRGRVLSDDQGRQRASDLSSVVGADQLSPTLLTTGQPAVTTSAVSTTVDPGRESWLQHRQLIRHLRNSLNFLRAADSTAEKPSLNEEVSSEREGDGGGDIGPVVVAAAAASSGTSSVGTVANADAGMQQAALENDDSVDSVLPLVQSLKSICREEKNLMLGNEERARLIEEIKRLLEEIIDFHPEALEAIESIRRAKKLGSNGERTRSSRTDIFNSLVAEEDEDGDEEEEEEEEEKKNLTSQQQQQQQSRRSYYDDPYYPASSNRKMDDHHHLEIEVEVEEAEEVAVRERGRFRGPARCAAGIGFDEQLAALDDDEKSKALLLSRVQPGNHMAASHDDTSEGAVHCFQDQDGHWWTYTFCSNGTGTAQSLGTEQEVERRVRRFCESHYIGSPSTSRRTSARRTANAASLERGNVASSSSDDESLLAVLPSMVLRPDASLSLSGNDPTATRFNNVHFTVDDASSRIRNTGGLSSRLRSFDAHFARLADSRPTFHTHRRRRQRHSAAVGRTSAAALASSTVSCRGNSRQPFEMQLAQSVGVGRGPGTGHSGRPAETLGSLTNYHPDTFSLPGRAVRNSIGHVRVLGNVALLFRRHRNATPTRPDRQKQYYRVPLVSALFGRDRFVNVHFDRLRLSALFDRTERWSVVCLDVLLAMLVSSITFLLIRRRYYYDFGVLFLCCSSAGAQFSLLKSVQPDAASPIHGHNSIIPYSRPVYFSLIGSAILLLEPISIALFEPTLLARLRPVLQFCHVLLVRLLLFLPLVFTFGLLPQLDTFLCHLFEQIDMHIFGGTAVFNLRSAVYALTRSVISVLLLSAVLYPTLAGCCFSSSFFSTTVTSASQNVAFSAFCGLLVSVAYLLSRLSSDPRPLASLFDRICSTVKKIDGDSCGRRRRRRRQSEEQTVDEQQQHDNNSNSNNEHHYNKDDDDSVDWNRQISALSMNRWKNSLFVSCSIGLLAFAIHCSTVFSKFRFAFGVVWPLLTVFVGLTVHYLLPQLRQHTPFLLLAQPILKAREYGLFDVSSVAKLMWFERLYVWLCCLERHLLYPTALLSMITETITAWQMSDDSVKLRPGQFQQLVLFSITIAGLKLFRLAFSNPSSLYVPLALSLLVTFVDGTVSTENLLFSLYAFSIFYPKLRELVLKLRFIFAYVAPWQISWGSAFHAFAQPCAVSHSAFTLIIAAVSSLLSAPLNPFMGSSVFLMSYVRPVKFWEKDYSTKRVDHSNTRLITQLAGQPTTDDSSLNAIFYEHLTGCLRDCLAGDLMLGRFASEVEPGDCFILASFYLNCLIHVVEIGNGFVSFQLRGLEFRGTYCQQREVEAITEELNEIDHHGPVGGAGSGGGGVGGGATTTTTTTTTTGTTGATTSGGVVAAQRASGGNGRRRCCRSPSSSSSSTSTCSCCYCCCCCCSCCCGSNSVNRDRFCRLPGLLTFSSLWNVRWLAWEIKTAKYILDGYSVSENSAISLFQLIELRKLLVTLYVKSIIYYTVRSPKLADWLRCETILEALQLIESNPVYVDVDTTFCFSNDEDYDIRRSGISRESFSNVYIPWIACCWKRSNAYAGFDWAHFEQSENLITLCYALSLFGRRLLGAASQTHHTTNAESFLYGLYALFKGDFRITCTRDEWVFSDMEILGSIIGPAVRMAVKLHQDHFTFADDLEDEACLYAVITFEDSSIFISHENDPNWRRAVLSNTPKLLALRHVSEDGQDDFKIIMLNKRHVSFRVIKLNRECVRAFWAGQQQELIFLRNRNPERGSIQNARQVLRNIINSSADQPIGYPIYVSPLTTSYCETHPQLSKVLGPDLLSMFGRKCSLLWRQLCLNCGMRGSSGANVIHHQQQQQQQDTTLPCRTTSAVGRCPTTTASAQGLVGSPSTAEAAAASTSTSTSTSTSAFASSQVASHSNTSLPLLGTSGRAVPSDFLQRSFTLPVDRASRRSACKSETATLIPRSSSKQITPDNAIPLDKMSTSTSTAGSSSSSLSSSSSSSSSSSHRYCQCVISTGDQGMQATFSKISRVPNDQEQQQPVCCVSVVIRAEEKKSSRTMIKLISCQKMDEIAYVAPERGSTIYKDECVFCFDSPEFEHGLYICLVCHVGVCRNHVVMHVTRTDHVGYLNLIREKKLLIDDNDDDDAAPPKQITKLAIGVESGFLEKRYEVRERWAVSVYPELELVPLFESTLGPGLLYCCKAIMEAESAYRLLEVQSQAGTWDGTMLKNTIHTNLFQVDNPPKIPPSGWRCQAEGCDKIDNLWLNLTDGMIFCGRKLWGGGGGNNHSMDHYCKTGYPLSVKLGTISSNGADVFSYDEDDLVNDPQLEKHLKHFGIDLAVMEKTEKSMIELELDFNQKWEFHEIQEEGNKLTPVYGPGYTGMVNMGNSCYLNSVIQALVIIPDIVRVYWDGADRIFQNCSLVPCDDFNVQFAKVVSGLLSGRYSRADMEDRRGIRPAAFRLLINRGNAEFASNRQQDVEEFMRYLFELLEQNKRGIDCVEDVVSTWRFSLEEKLTCLESGNVSYKQRPEVILSLPVPLGLEQEQIDPTTLENDENRPPSVVGILPDEPAQLTMMNGAGGVAGVDSSGGGSGAGNDAAEIVVTSSSNSGTATVETGVIGPKLRPTVSLMNCLKALVEPELLDNTKSPFTGRISAMEKQLHFNTFPDWLWIQMKKFTFAPDWRPLKLDVSIAVPDLLDMNEFRGSGPHVGKLKMEYTKDSDDEQQPSAKPELVSQLIDMGFAESDVRTALIETANNLEIAVQWLLSGGVDGQGSGGAGGSSFNSRLSNDVPSSTEVQFRDGNGLYRLRGFISHIGSSAHTGHYVCHLLKGDQWIIYNDEKVALSEKPPKDLGYVFLYERISTTD
ncbi:Pecanex-like protein 1 [Trichinella britovi]|uniref:Pecanex-like protein n=1 Tax=Trichinella britovi TaxID=45882 RepID=A0A0V1CVI6_TRIBR|nr:Pecanex-like protein 1 [Trichinella britovi]